MLINEFLLYAALAGAAVYGLSYWMTKKDKGLAGLITAVLAFIVVVFIFPGAGNAENLSDIFSNLTLLIQKGIYLVGWFAGAFAVSKLIP
ncbi:hypothetical protein [Pseudomonas anguilliseptica]|uniref:Uncharacterized protein n=1 Tax=Pseudomonas anguilliseptica TaxID=53406 RepID=A0A1H4XWV1_PSEAG|nr:hypothetical protein [Pseudomonas anguilliseptica]SED10143.1 hypothetical protein SAMN05421553_2031 [Pseudomonas anguilliseptica]